MSEKFPKTKPDSPPFSVGARVRYIGGKRLFAGYRQVGLLEPGMEYVVGVPPQTPVLRALKQPLFDTLIVPEDGIRDEQEIALFVDRKSFPDGRRKMRADCNLPCDQVLGYPLEYDFSSLELRFEKWAHPDDVRRVLRGIHLTWIFGQGTPWLRLTGSGFKPLFVLPHEVEDMRATIEQQVIKYAETGVWPAWTQDLTAAVAEERSRTLAALKEHGADSKDIRLPQGRARRISSTEAFSCRVACNVSEMHAPVRLKVMMQDTLYACL